MPKANFLQTNDPTGALYRLGLDPCASKVLIVGLGKTGLSVARFLSGHGIPLAVVDSRPKPPMLTELQETLPNAAMFLGSFDTSAFEVATHLIVSPGVSLEVPAIRRCRESGVALLSDIDLFAAMALAPVVAVTGSNGKSTVTTLVGCMAEAAGIHVKAGGNLGTPALDLLDPKAELYVLELSSFQLERTTLLKPAAAAVLNVSNDHMDRYSGLAHYAAEKRRIFSGEGVMVLNGDDPLVAAMAEARRRCVRFGLKPDSGMEYGVRTIEGAEWMVHGETPLIRTEDLRIKGRHNIANALAALALGDAVALPRLAMYEALRRFPGLEHRMQQVAESGGVVWFNDSKATNIGACIAALEGVAGKVVLLAGGDGKGVDFSELAPAVVEKARAVILMGKDARLIEEALSLCTIPVHSRKRRFRVQIGFPADLSGGVEIHHAANMQQAVEIAKSVAQPGDTVLLAPACSSLDQYADYQERGRVFVEAVRRLAI